VAFTSSANNLVTGDPNGKQDVFLRDLFTGTTALVSVNTNGNGPGNGVSESPMVNADGRFILFASAANNLAPIRSNLTENLFLRDMQAGQTYALTATNGYVGAVMTPDGKFVAFATIDNPSSGQANLYVWDSHAAMRMFVQPNA